MVGLINFHNLFKKLTGGGGGKEALLLFFDLVMMEFILLDSNAEI
jgi:hypothetical protein